MPLVNKGMNRLPKFVIVPAEDTSIWSLRGVPRYVSPSSALPASLIVTLPAAMMFWN